MNKDMIRNQLIAAFGKSRLLSDKINFILVKNIRKTLGMPSKSTWREFSNVRYNFLHLRISSKLAEIKWFIAFSYGKLSASPSEVEIKGAHLCQSSWHALEYDFKYL